MLVKKNGTLVQTEKCLSYNYLKKSWMRFQPLSYKPIKTTRRKSMFPTTKRTTQRVLLRVLLLLALLIALAGMGQSQTASPAQVRSFP